MLLRWAKWYKIERDEGETAGGKQPLGHYSLIKKVYSTFHTHTGLNT